MIHRDEIHGDIRYDELAVALLDTAQLQRLGRVYQLGFGHLVYRGGTHTRLSHSMGAYYTASHLAKGLRRNYLGTAPPPEGALRPEDFLPRAMGPDAGRKENESNGLANRWSVLGYLVSWAALLHDIGHVPIGHTLEDEFADIYERHDSFGSPRFRYLWLDPESEVAKVLKRTELYPEAFSALGIDNGKLVLEAVTLICVWKERNSKAGRTKFETILDGVIKDEKSEQERPDEVQAARDLRQAVQNADQLFRPYMADLVANTISADYLDYLRRDPHNLGLDVLRDGRIASRFWIGKDHHDQPRMALSLVDRRNKPRLDTCTSVVELVRQRYRFAEIVYYHKTKVAASAMLAKAFHLLEKPKEVPLGGRTPPTIVDAADRVEAIFDTADSSKRSKLLGELRADCTPQSLLDPEIGDEGLGLFLRHRAIEILERSLRKRDKQDREEALTKARNAMRGIALVDALARRQLYKTAFTMDPALFPEIAGYRDTPAPDLERELREFIEILRKSSEERDALEQKMVEAAGWPPCSVLLYVPDRKSQAKGIETGALANGQVITLGSHPAVADEVAKLSERYRALWRLIVLVHPDYATDMVGLSAAIDAFIEDRFPRVSLGAHGAIDAIERGCWFYYQDRGGRSAAREFAKILSVNGDGPDAWRSFREYSDAHRASPPRQRVRGGLVLHRLELNSKRDGRDLLGHLGTPRELDDRIEAEYQAIVEGQQRLLEGDDDRGIHERALDEAIERVVKEIGRSG
jgi:HD superfamily phosphohydrolase